MKKEFYSCQSSIGNLSYGTSIMKKYIILSLIVVFGFIHSYIQAADVFSDGKKVFDLTQADIDNSTAEFTSDAYVKGLWVDYVSSTTIVINIGEARSNHKYFIVDAPVTQILLTVTSATNVHNVYISDSDSTFPSSPVFYDSTTDPIQLASQGGGYYNSTSQNDRLIVPLFSFTSAVLHPFEGSPAKTILFVSDAARFEGNAGAPDSTFQTPNNEPGANWIPISASHVRIGGQSRDTGGDGTITGVATLETAAANNVFFSELLWYSTGGGFEQFNAWLPIGPSRDLRWWGADNDDDVVIIYYFGYRYDI